jgi:ribosomal protein S18 acetylase RimI-like enzyme
LTKENTDNTGSRGFEGAGRGSTPSDEQLLRRLEYDPKDYAPADWHVVTAPPFRMATSTVFGISEVAPVQSIDISTDITAALRRLVKEARGAGSRLGFAFNESLWPGLGRRLDAFGLVMEKREPLLACIPGTFRPASSPRVDTRFLNQADSRTEFDAFQSVVLAGQGEGYDVLSDAALARFREEVRSDGIFRAVIARVNGKPVGTGYAWCNLGRTEITRIHTLESARRQGVASAVMSELVGDAFKQCGDLVWLTASGTPAVALYEKLGFRRLGDRLFYQESVS